MESARSGEWHLRRATKGDAMGTRIDRPENVTRDHAVTGVSVQRNIVRLRAGGLERTRKVQLLK